MSYTRFSKGLIKNIISRPFLGFFVFCFLDILQISMKAQCFSGFIILDTLCRIFRKYAGCNSAYSLTMGCNSSCSKRKSPNFAYSVRHYGVELYKLNRQNFHGMNLCALSECAEWGYAYFLRAVLSETSHTPNPGFYIVLALEGGLKKKPCFWQFRKNML